ncbi:restriction endonuclease subunit S [Primorskyibacter flagellatus]|uniref:Type I restriction enzyme, S subunit n=1 Tax=Primorskyibacter flagellatus TaxID=1387277 RepID=A0A1W2E405_9RHOB|nr:restriction endonuclease subunit S [Primorskyibacter flagellatus]SMD04493.1 type I restriction enzyme, S subunit [Primorskyibacter flagellatus]
MMEATYPAHESYKPSGYDWVGNVPSHWGVEKLGTSLRSVSEKNRPDLPLLSITRELGVIERDLDDEESNHNFIPDDLSGYKVLRAGQFGMNKMKAWQGSYGVSQHTGIVSPAYFIFDFTKEIDPDFFNRAIRSKLYVSYFGSASDGVRIGQWDLNKARMREIPLLVPPLPEQRAIAAFLDDKCAKIDDAAKIKEGQIALLHERRQIIIQDAVTRGLNPAAPMKDSGIDWISQIPAHWEIKKVKHFGRNRSGDGVTNSQLTDEGVYEVWGGNGLMGFSDKFNVDGDYIVIGRVGAYCGNIRLAKGKRWVSDNALILRISRAISSPFLAQALQAANLNRLNESNAQPLITGGKVSNLSIPFPPLEEQDQIVDHIKWSSQKIEDGIAIKEAQITALKEYKTSLINAAVTGKIKVI